MASADDVTLVSSRLDGGEDFSAGLIGTTIDRFVNLDLATAELWEIRASRYHALVNISESGSSREMGKMYSNALEMAKYYRGKYTDSIDDPGEVAPAVGRTRTTRIIRI